MVAGCEVVAVTDGIDVLGVDEDEESVPELDVEEDVELELFEEVLELDAEGDAELEAGEEVEDDVVVEEDDCEPDVWVCAASERSFADAVSVAAAALERGFVVDAAADLTTCVLPVAMIAVSSARAPVAAAAVQRVTRRRRRTPAARARRSRRVGSFMEAMEPGRPGTRLPASCESSVRVRNAPEGSRPTPLRPGCALSPVANPGARRSSPPRVPDGQARGPERLATREE